MSAISSLTEICKARDNYCHYFKSTFPTYNIRTFLAPKSYTYDIEVVFIQPNFEFIALIPYDCKDPITYFKNYYPEFFI